jgi:hypothetical protein
MGNFTCSSGAASFELLSMLNAALLAAGAMLLQSV